MTALPIKRLPELRDVSSRLIDALVQKIPEQSSEQLLGKWLLDLLCRCENHTAISEMLGHATIRFQAFFLELQLVVPRAQ